MLKFKCHNCQKSHQAAELHGLLPLAEHHFKFRTRMCGEAAGEPGGDDEGAVHDSASPGVCGPLQPSADRLFYSFANPAAKKARVAAAAACGQSGETAVARSGSMNQMYTEIMQRVLYYLGRAGPLGSRSLEGTAEFVQRVLSASDRSEQPWGSSRSFERKEAGRYSGRFLEQLRQAVGKSLRVIVKIGKNAESFQANLQRDYMYILARNASMSLGGHCAGPPWKTVRQSSDASELNPDNWFKANLLDMVLRVLARVLDEGAPAFTLEAIVEGAPRRSDPDIIQMLTDYIIENHFRGKVVCSALFVGIIEFFAKGVLPNCGWLGSCQQSGSGVRENIGCALVEREMCEDGIQRFCGKAIYFLSNSDWRVFRDCDVSHLVANDRKPFGLDFEYKPLLPHRMRLPSLPYNHAIIVENLFAWSTYGAVLVDRLLPCSVGVAMRLRGQRDAQGAYTLVANIAKTGDDPQILREILESLEHLLRDYSVRQSSVHHLPEGCENLLLEVSFFGLPLIAKNMPFAEHRKKVEALLAEREDAVCLLSDFKSSVAMMEGIEAFLRSESRVLMPSCLGTPVVVATRAGEPFQTRAHTDLFVVPGEYQEASLSDLLSSEMSAQASSSQGRRGSSQEAVGGQEGDHNVHSGVECPQGVSGHSGREAGVNPVPFDEASDALFANRSLVLLSEIKRLLVGDAALMVRVENGFSYCEEYELANIAFAKVIMKQFAVPAQERYTTLADIRVILDIGYNVGIRDYSVFHNPNASAAFYHDQFWGGKGVVYLTREEVELLRQHVCGKTVEAVQESLFGRVYDRRPVNQLMESRLAVYALMRCAYYYVLAWQHLVCECHTKGLLSRKSDIPARQLAVETFVKGFLDFAPIYVGPSADARNALMVAQIEGMISRAEWCHDARSFDSDYLNCRDFDASSSLQDIVSVIETDKAAGSGATVSGDGVQGAFPNVSSAAEADGLQVGAQARSPSPRASAPASHEGSDSASPPSSVVVVTSIDSGMGEGRGEAHDDAPSVDL